MHGQAKQVSSEERTRTGGEAEDTRNGTAGMLGESYSMCAILKLNLILEVQICVKSSRHKT